MTSQRCRKLTGCVITAAQQSYNTDHTYSSAGIIWTPITRTSIQNEHHEHEWTRELNLCFLTPEQQNKPRQKKETLKDCLESSSCKRSETKRCKPPCGLIRCNCLEERLLRVKVLFPSSISPSHSKRDVEKKIALTGRQEFDWAALHQKTALP